MTVVQPSHMHILLPDAVTFPTAEAASVSALSIGSLCLSRYLRSEPSRTLSAVGLRFFPFSLRVLSQSLLRFFVCAFATEDSTMTVNIQGPPREGVRWDNFFMGFWLSIKIVYYRLATRYYLWRCSMIPDDADDAKSPR